jgi:cobalt-zinc-cadmium efflux system outer membrane protein
MNRNISGIVIVAMAVVAIATVAQASTLSGPFEAAVERSADVKALLARMPEQTSKRDSAGALLPGGWSITVSAESDAMTTQRGASEYATETAFPIWLPGERGATARSADRALLALEADLARKRMEIAKSVRDAYWEFVEAREKLALAERRLGIAKSLATDTRRRVDAGQAAEVDALIAEAELSDAEAAVAERRGELDRALIQFKSHTGLAPPPRFSEQLHRRADTHPTIRAFAAAVSKAEAERHLVEVVDRDRPELALTTKTDRGDREEPYNTQIGARLKIPFSYEPVNAPKRAAAIGAVVAAKAELDAAERAIKLDVDRSRAKLDGARRQLAALEKRFSQLSAAVVLIQRSQQTGQTALSELIRARIQMFDAANARALAQIAVERAKSEINQAQGIEP